MEEQRLTCSHKEVSPPEMNEFALAHDEADDASEYVYNEDDRLFW